MQEETRFYKYKYGREDLSFLENVFTVESIRKVLSVLQKMYGSELSVIDKSLLKLKLRSVIRSEAECWKSFANKTEKHGSDRGVRAWYRLDNDEKYIVVTNKKCILFTPYQVLLLMGESVIVFIDKGYTQVDPPEGDYQMDELSMNVYHPKAGICTVCRCYFDDDYNGIVSCFHRHYNYYIDI